MKIMKHLMRYEGYTTQQRVDDLLDKISKYGIKSLTQLEKEFLDAHKTGSEEEAHKKLTKSESENVFVDDTGLFRFEFDHCEDFGDEWNYHGVIYVPDLKLPNGKVLKGKLNGYIVYHHETGIIIPEFYYQTANGTTYEIFDFCSGNEYELDSFLDYVVSEIENED